jgi:hypothetical protein
MHFIATQLNMVTDYNELELEMQHTESIQNDVFLKVLYATHGFLHLSSTSESTTSADGEESIFSTTGVIQYFIPFANSKK